MIDSEIMDCTFKPKINKNSDKAIREIRGQDTNETVNDRLYNTSSLYLEQRKRMIEEERLKEEKLEEMNCTFQPKLLTRSSSFHQRVSTKYDQPTNGNYHY